MKNIRKSHDAAYKAKVALEAVKGGFIASSSKGVAGYLP